MLAVQAFIFLQVLLVTTVIVNAECTRSSFINPKSTPLCFAASKKNKKGGGKKKKSSTASSNKGFGIAPPTFEEVVASFSNRQPKAPNDEICPCGIVDGRKYGDCCGKLHRGEETCQTMTDVLRSRYTAFAWRDVAYVISTTHETCRDHRDDKIAWAKDLNKSGMFDSFEFVGLEAGPEEPGENENEGYLDFKVTLRDKGERDLELAGKETVISERSKFVRDPETGVWSYSSGEVRSEVAGLEDTVLNQ